MFCKRPGIIIIIGLICMLESAKQMIHNHESYSPGECNIGPAQVSRRKRNGWIFSGIATLLVIINWNDTPGLLNGFLLFIAVFIASLSFLQADRHFCVMHGITGTQYFSRARKVVSDNPIKARSKDLRKSTVIGGQAILISLAVTAMVVVIRWFLQAES